MPFGPASSFSTPASRHMRFSATTCSRLSTSARQRAEAVDQLGGHGLALGVGGQRADAAVEAEADGQVGDVGLGDQHGQAELDVGRPVAVLGALAAALGAHLDDRVLQHLLVELDADLADMAGLLVAEQVAGAADVEVVARRG